MLDDKALIESMELLYIRLLRAVRYFSLIFIVSFSVRSEAEVTIAAYHIDGLYDPLHSGLYDQILERMRKFNVQFNVKHLSIVKAARVFKTQGADCLSPVEQAANHFPFPIIESDTLNLAKAYVFWRRGDKPKPLLSDLSGLVVGSQEGMVYGDAFEGIDIFYQKSQYLQSAYKALLAGRIDVMVAYTPDVWLLYGDKTIPNIEYDISKPFWVHHDRIVCHKTAENQYFIEAFNKQLALLNSSGELKRILGLSYTSE